MRTSVTTLAFIVLASSLAAVGCSKKMTITQYPAFYTESLRSVAVVPFRSATKETNAGLVVSENFSRALMQNNTYQVFNNNDLGAIEGQRDLMIYAETGDASVAASKLRPGGKVQAMLVGTVTTYAKSTSTQRRQDPIQSWDSVNKMWVTTGYRTYDYTRNEGTVAVSAAMIRISDGTQIHATAEAVGREASEGEVPSMDAYECLRRATEKAVRQLVAEFAVTRQTISFADKDFKTASDLYDGKWTYTDRFKASEEKMFVALKLPPSCDRNKFRVTMIRQGQRVDLAEANFVWQRGWSEEAAHGFEFSPKKIVEVGGGPGTFEAKFYNGPEVIAVRSFRIE